MPAAITPLPIPSNTPGILLFGGMFDPPHLAHVELAVGARDAALAPGAWLVYVPAARSPHKPDGPVASDADRLAMLRLALEGREQVSIWTDELDRAGDGPSYWVETLERARRSYPGELRFLIGADQVLAFHRWHRWPRVLELAEPVVILRAPTDTPKRLGEALRATGAWTESKVEQWLDRIVPGESLPVSSTDVREHLRDREGPVADLDERVRAYIEARGIYADRPV